MTIIGLPILTLIVWALIGFIVSLIVGLVDPGKIKGGMLVSLLFGIVGGLLGGIITSYILNTGETQNLTRSILFAALGGLILTLAHHLMFRITGQIKTMTKEDGRI